MREEVLTSKKELVDEISGKFESSASAVVVEYRGLSVAQVTDLRRQLRSEGIDFKVYKNTMTRRAVEKSGFEGLLDSLVGPNAIAFSDDAVAPSRVLANFAKKNKALVIKQGIVEGKVLGVDEIKEISQLPNREGMIAMLLGALQSPIRDFAWAVKQISEQQGGSTEAAPVEETEEKTTEEVVSEEKAEETPEEKEGE